ncbi:hypothetical protein ACLIMP_26115 (plasmid) [Novosphingobium aerophilum]|uniref:hypothetical protein n=1 Tax=Novosphingobium aerophilum TaxID=2839843 RepID=UPI003FD0DB1D
MEIALKQAFGLPTDKRLAEVGRSEQRSTKAVEIRVQSVSKPSRNSGGRSGLGGPTVEESGSGTAPLHPKRTILKARPKPSKRTVKAARAIEREKAAECSRLARIDAKEKKAEAKRVKVSRRRTASERGADARRALNARMREARSIAAAQASPFDDLLAKWKRELTTLRRLEERDPGAPSVALARSRLEAIEFEWERRRGLMPDQPEYFAWPTTEVTGGVSAVGKVQWQPIGILAYLGYHVGKSSDLTEVQRQRLLAHIYGMRLPPVNDLAYMLAWDRPATASRLRKLADTLAALIRNAKRRQSIKLDAAIYDWERDLTYLKEEFYVGRYDFSWPTV